MVVLEVELVGVPVLPLGQAEGLDLGAGDHHLLRHPLHGGAGVAGAHVQCRVRLQSNLIKELTRLQGLWTACQ